jgi:hypothetical protein
MNSAAGDAARTVMKEMEQLRADLTKSQELLAAALLEIKQLDRLRELHFESHTKDLAEREAEIATYRDVLHKLACLGNGKAYGNSFGNDIAREALSTPQSTSYLEQWEKERFGEPVGYFDQEYMGGPVIFTQVNYSEKDREGVFPLYARKEEA